jgi:Spy/CpxP family protein refolding chaperone
MRRIKILSTTLVLLAAAAGPAAAQQGGGGMRMDPAQMVQRSTDRLLTGITLTATQQDSVKAITARQTTEIQAAFQSGDRSKMMDMRQHQRTELRGILTADQQKVFDKNVEDMEKARANRGAGGPPGGR